MTTQTNLPLIWAATGGVTDPGDIKYSTGWVAEIPTYQNFNFVLQNQSKNLLALAERGKFEWESDINYIPGAQVIKNNTLYTCITSHSNQDPVTDTTRSYWVLGYAWGTNSANLTDKEGLYIHEVNARGTNTWDGNDITIQNDNASIALNTTGSSHNFILSNVNGKIKLNDVGATEIPDGRDLSTGYELFHEGHPPVQAEVAGTIPANALDGKLYGRRNGNWVEVTTTVIQEHPPQPVAGNGTGWYNLQDGTLYLDIDDGDTSQWVPAAPSANFDTKVNKAGDIMHGSLNIKYGATPLLTLQPESIGGYPQLSFRDALGYGRGLLFLAEVTGDIILRRGNTAGVIETALTLGNNGNVLISGQGSAPINVAHLTRKDYVDLISDERLKENLVPVNSLDTLELLNVYDFDWKEGANRSGKSTGVMAQQLLTVLPHLVNTQEIPEEVDDKGNVIKEATEYLYINRDGLQGNMLRAIQELSAKNKELEAKIDIMQEQIDNIIASLGGL